MNLFSEDKGNVLTDFINPFDEIIAYEVLWSKKGTSFRRLSELFKKNPGKRPSDFVTREEIEEHRSIIRDIVLKKDQNYPVNLLINKTFDYPQRLKDAKEPVEVLYYSGNLDYLHEKSIAIVGTRKPTNYGLRRAAKLAKLLVEDGFTIVSGLAEGIDTMAHKTAIENGGKTIAVIGTPLNEYYPKKNKNLQNIIASDHLLISQVPYYRYMKQNFLGNRLFFPERNKTMSALSKGTVIIEASETSGTLTQARAALHQGRKLFILDSCFLNKNITWPMRFLEKGAIRVKTYDDIINNL